MIKFTDLADELLLETISYCYRDHPTVCALIAITHRLSRLAKNYLYREINL